MSSTLTSLFENADPHSDIYRPLLRATSNNALFLGGSLTLHSHGKEYEYAYGPKGIAGIRKNSYALACAFFVSIGGLEFGYDQGVIANVLVMEDFIQRWPLTPLQKGIITAALELGALTGALLTGVFTDRLSRNQSIMLASVVFCIGSAFQCSAQSFYHMLLGRAIGGVGVGALSMLAPLYLAETSPREVRGSLMALEQFSIVMGVIFGFWIGFLTRSIHGSASWRIPLGLQLVPGIILGIGCFFLPPSPRLLVLQGRDDEALSSLATLRLRSQEEAASDPLLLIELKEMKVDTLVVARTLELGSGNFGLGFFGELSAWGHLFGPKYRTRTMVGILVMVFQQWTGINALLYYGPTLVRSLGLSGDKVSLLVSGGIGIVQLVAVVPTILFIDQWGRKPLLRGGSAAMALSHTTIFLLAYLYQDDWPTHPKAAWMAVIGIYVFTASYGVSFGPIGWVLPSEIFPLSMRSRGLALSTASNWFNNFIIGLITPTMMNLSTPGTFLMFACASFIAYLWSTYIIPETANISLEEMDKVFMSEVGREDAILKRQIEEELGLWDLITELLDQGHLED